MSRAPDDAPSDGLRNVRLVAEPFATASEPIPLLTNVDTPDPVYAWLPSVDQLRPLTTVDQDASTSPIVLTPGGHAALYSWATLDAPHDASTPLSHRVRNRGIYRLDFASGTLERVSFEPRSGWQNLLRFAASPDGRTIAIAESWQTTLPGQPARHDEARLTLWLADFSGTPARAVFTITASAPGGGAYQPVQWSPDGTMIALSVGLFGDTPQGFAAVVKVIDAATGHERTNVEGLLLQGSVSWSPDSCRLLVQDLANVEHVLDIATGAAEPIPFLLGKSAAARPRLLGFADDRRLLVATQRGTTMTVSSADPDTGVRRPLMRWTAGHYMYPLVAQMPPGYWDARTASGPAHPPATTTSGASSAPTGRTSCGSGT